MTQEQKRKISVGFLKPSELEKITIYVQISKKDEKNSDLVYAEAVSNCNFNYIAHSLCGNRLLEKGTKANNLDGDVNNSYVRNYNGFIEMLKEENNGEIEYRFEKDGLELTKKVAWFKKMYKELERSISLMNKRD